MRKLFLAVLVLLAAAALGFAQDAAGTVTWSGEARIGALADFTPEDPIVKPDSDRHGQVVFSYDKGALNTEVQARVAYDGGSSVGGPLNGYFGLLGEYGDGVNSDSETPYRVHANLRFFTDSRTNFQIDKLYGYYLFLDKQLKLDVAYKGYETIYWRVSDIVSSAWDNLDGKIGLAL